MSISATSGKTTLLTLRQRRFVAITVTSLLVIAWFIGAYVVEVSLGHRSVYSGATLLACLIGLVSIGMRKRVPVLPLFTVSTWVQIHIYTGMFAFLVYTVHVPSILASGNFEAPLSWMFIGVSVSGFYGLYLSRVAPKRLTAIGSEVRYDRIRWHRSEIIAAANHAVTELTDSPSREVLEGFYEGALVPYFRSKLPLSYLLYPNSFRRRRLLAQLNELGRYFDTSSQSVAGKLAGLVRRRDDLNYQHAIQFRLRAWIALHSAVSALLVIWAIVHTYLAIGMLGT